MTSSETYICRSIEHPLPNLRHLIEMVMTEWHDTHPGQTPKPTFQYSRTEYVVYGITITVYELTVTIETAT